MHFFQIFATTFNLFEWWTCKRIWNYVSADHIFSKVKHNSSDFCRIPITSNYISKNHIFIKSCLIPAVSHGRVCESVLAPKGSIGVLTSRGISWELCLAVCLLSYCILGGTDLKELIAEKQRLSFLCFKIIYFIFEVKGDMRLRTFYELVWHRLPIRRSLLLLCVLP